MFLFHHVGNVEFISIYIKMSFSPVIYNQVLYYDNRKRIIWLWAQQIHRFITGTSFIWDFLILLYILN